MKFLGSHNWQRKFTDIAQQFWEHKNELQHRLAIHTNHGVAVGNKALVQIQADLTHVNRVMEMVFEQLNSNEERKVAKFVENKGGRERVLESDALLNDLLKLQNSRNVQSAAGNLVGPLMSVGELREGLTKDLEKVLEEDRKTFDQKFKAQQDQIEAVRATVVTQGDRITNLMLSGPYEQIVDRVRTLL